MRIGELAQQSGVSAQTVRFYERRGLVRIPARGSNGYREYDSSVASRLAFIRSAQTAGLTLAEIGGILAVRDADQAPCVHVTGLLTEKLDDVHERQRDLARLEVELQQLLQASQRLDPAGCTVGEVCHIITRARPSTD